MSIKIVHIIFIALAALVSAGAGVWGVREGQGLSLGFGVISFLFSAALAAYGFAFLRKMKETGIS